VPSRAGLLAALAALTAAVVGCSAVGLPGGPAARPAPMPECDTDNLAFFGENVTLAAIGIDQSMAGTDANRPATIWVTRDPVPDPAGVPPGGGPPAPPQRWVCAEFDDGSGMGMSLDPSWELRTPSVAADQSGATPPVGTILVAVAAIAVAAVSYLAFRRGDG
jgi:hypothetical protein